MSLAWPSPPTPTTLPADPYNPGRPGPGYGATWSWRYGA